MPIYEYRCEACGTAFEELIATGDTAVSCPECGSQRARRAYSAPAASPRLAKSAGGKRRQEGRNAELRERAKADFKAARATSSTAEQTGGR